MSRPSFWANKADTTPISRNIPPSTGDKAENATKASTGPSIQCQDFPPGMPKYYPGGLAATLTIGPARWDSVNFAAAYKSFIEYHLARRQGEARRRLEKGLGHAELAFLEKVWWPAFYQLQNLHPEFELVDFDGRRRFLDFAYLYAGIKLALEIDGYGPHLTNLDRWQFTNQLRRQNHLILDGWSVLRFSFDEVQDQPRQCQRVLQQFFGRQRSFEQLDGLSFLERSVVQLALRADGPITPVEVRSRLEIGRYKASQVLQSLVAQGWLEPASGSRRIRSYRLRPERRMGL